MLSIKTFAKRALLCLLLIATSCPHALGQKITNLTRWTQLSDPNTESGETQPVRTLARIVGLPQATVEVTLGCHHDDKPSGPNMSFSSNITVFITISGAKLDKKLLSSEQSKQVNLDYLLITQRWDEREEKSSPDEGLPYDYVTTEHFFNGYTRETYHYLPPDLHHFAYVFPTAAFANAKNEYAVSFSVDYLDVTLLINRHQPAVSSFVEDCRNLTPKQLRIAAIEVIQREKRAAEDARAEAAHKEQERTDAEQQRIVQAQAAEQQRIAAEQAAEQARISAEKKAAYLTAAQHRRDEAIARAIGNTAATVNEAQLSSLIVGKSAIPTVELGYSGTLGNQFIVNGRPRVFLINTLIFADGSERFRVEDGMIRNDAVSHKTFKPWLTFAIKKVEFRSDNLEIKLVIPSTGEAADMKLMLSKDWQKSMSNESVLAAIDKSLNILW